MNNQTILSALAAITFAVVPVHTNASSVFVSNASFEADITSDHTVSAPTGWTIVPGTGSDVGTFRPSPSLLIPTDGAQTAWSNGPSIAQDLSSALTSNTQYTLSVDIGKRTDLVIPGYRIRLLAGTTLLAEDFNSLPSLNGFQTSTVSITSSLVDPLAGQFLRIELRNLNQGVGQINWDNVRLEATSIPEPSSATFYAGFICMTFLITRRRFLKP